MQDSVFTLLNESLWLLCIGMAVVFLFLTLLIGAIKLIKMLCYEEPKVQTTPNLSANQQNADNAVEGIAPNVVAAITAAVHQHRQSK
ncbi:OadG family protein [Alteromonas sp. a30]|uniref:OadG family protein n=1 Tax=Alteromonas sp. a30 TaxID=2730917 RepID=UPI002282017F|nr:OadG family transporter subunit [Alteromonas sp. a30]MCY7297052.1 sodium pump decarboxylase subunit gamma [Alteromonas sp. a30]